jgi:hypothetical protein
MRITAEQLVTLTMNLHMDHRFSGRQFYEAYQVRDELLREHPDLDGVDPPPGYDHIRQAYLPPSWQRVQMREPYHPERSAVRPLTDRDLRPEPHAASPHFEAGQRRDAWAPFQPPPDPIQQILDDLDVLRSDPMAALTYVCHRSRGIESAEAMRWARLTANVHSLLQITHGYIHADQRAESMRQGQEGMAGARQRGFHETWAPPAEPLSSVPPVNPADVRMALEHLEWEANVAAGR